MGEGDYNQIGSRILDLVPSAIKLRIGSFGGGEIPGIPYTVTLLVIARTHCKKSASLMVSLIPHDHPLRELITLILQRRNKRPREDRTCIHDNIASKWRA